MFKKPWFRFLVWSTALFFFFVSAMVLACLLAPPAQPSQIHSYMSGMMNAMMSSLMGVAMEPSNNLIWAYQLSTSLTILITFLAALFGLYFRIQGDEE